MNAQGGGNAVGLLCFLVFFAGILALVITIWWKIFEKTGHGGAMSLLMLLPIVNFIMLLILAFGEWPVHRELRRLQQELADREAYGGGRRFGGDPYRPPEQPRRGEGDTGYTR
jgi:hypothetical protein